MTRKPGSQNAGPDEKAEAIRLYVQEELTVREVAEKLRRSTTGVHNWLKAARVLRKHGVRRRRPSPKDT